MEDSSKTYVDHEEGCELCNAGAVAISHPRTEVSRKGEAWICVGCNAEYRVADDKEDIGLCLSCISFMNEVLPNAYYLEGDGTSGGEKDSRQGA